MSTATDTADLRRWRKELRGDLLAQRLAVPKAERDRVRSAVTAALDSAFAAARPGTVGFYWPFRNEVRLNPFVEGLVRRGWRAALPVVVAKAEPLEFWRWEPGAELRPGVWDIPVPARKDPVHPDVVLVPLVGFDPAGYRLGYGGGFYDRTLVALAPPPVAIGVGYDLCAIESVRPQSYDIAMDAIVTENGWRWRNSRFMAFARLAEAPDGAFASPACLLPEFDGPETGGNVGRG
jgi:5-formyltetrahydrofolate cyclo-ligase